MLGRRARTIIPLALLLLGAVLTAYAVKIGQASMYMVLFIPVIRIRGLIGAIGALMIFAGFILLHFLSFQGYVPSRETLKKRQRGYGQTNQRLRTSGGFGGVLLIGPIPIIFGAGKRGMLVPLIVAAMVLLLLLFFVIPYLLVWA